MRGDRLCVALPPGYLETIKEEARARNMKLSDYITVMINIRHYPYGIDGEGFEEWKARGYKL